MSVRILYGENQKPKTASKYDPQEKNKGGDRSRRSVAPSARKASSVSAKYQDPYKGVNSGIPKSISINGVEYKYTYYENNGHDTGPYWMRSSESGIPPESMRKTILTNLNGQLMPYVRQATHLQA